MTMWQRLKSWKLERDIRAGRKHRGRVPPKPPGVREKWLELCLRLRTLRAAVRFTFSEPLVGGTRGAVFPTGRLYVKKLSRDDDGNLVERDIGLVSTKVVTTVGVNYIVDAFQNSVELENMKYHACGTGAAAESQTDTALGTEVATRATGTTEEGASANIYRSVGTVSFAGSFAITEHGLFSAAASGVLLDRSTFGAINVVSGDAIQFTYELTLPAGS